MKGFVSALSLFPNAGAAAIGIGLSHFSVDPTVFWVYAGAAIASFLTAVVFYYMFREYDEEDHRMKMDMVDNSLRISVARSKAEIDLPLEGKA